MISTYIKICSFLLSFKLELASPTDYASQFCCQCNSVCPEADYGVLVFGKSETCKYTIRSGSGQEVRTSFYSIKWDTGDQAFMYYPFKDTQQSWGVPSSDADGPTIQAKEGSGELEIEIMKTNVESEFLIEFTTEHHLKKDRSFVASSCFSSSYAIRHGSLLFKVPDAESNYFYAHLTVQSSGLYAHYEQLVKQAFKDILGSSLSNFTGNHNLIVFSFSPGTFVNFALETLGDEFSAKTLNESLNAYSTEVTDHMIQFDSNSLQLNGDAPCLVMVSENPSLDKSTFEAQVKYALRDYCVFLHICDQASWNDVQITNMKFAASSKSLRAEFCVESVMVRRQLIEAMLNEKYTLIEQMGDFVFNYQLLPEGESGETRVVKTSGFSAVDYVWVSVVFLLLVLLTVVTLLAVWYYCHYKQTQRHFQRLGQEEGDLVPPAIDPQVQLRHPVNMHKDAVRASEISIMLKTGPRNTFFRPESQISLTGQENNPHKSMPDLSVPQTQVFQKRPAGYLYTRSKAQPNQTGVVYSRATSDSARVPSDRYSQRESATGEDQEYDPTTYERVPRTNTDRGYNDHYPNGEPQLSVRSESKVETDL